MNGSRWTPAQDAALAEAIKAGEPPFQIAQLLATVRPGVTRSAVINRADQLGLALPNPKVWPPSHLEALRALEGQTAGEMRDAMCKLRPGITRSAVIGQCKRHGIRLSNAGNGQAKIKAVAKRAQYKPALPTTTKRKPTPFLSAPVIDVTRPARAGAWEKLPGASAPIALTARSNAQCAWPIGEPTRPAEQMCCGERVADDTLPYCAAHRRLRLARYVPTELRAADKAA